MAGKLDKETFKKHHFWFLLIPIFLGLFIAWYGAMAEVPDAIEKTKGANEAEKKKQTGVKAQPRQMVDRYGDQIGKLGGRRTEMWKAGWEDQKDLFNWPSGYSQQQLDVVKNLKFGDDIPNDSVRNQFRERVVYEDEYKNLVKTIAPIGFRDNSWETVLRYVQNWGRVPSPEDMWLAMEDFWVQRDVLLAIHQINVNAAKFARVEFSGDGPTNRKFKSRIWEIELQVAENAAKKRVLSGKLKNISGRLQVLGVTNSMKMKVWLSPDAPRPFDLVIEGTSVPADAQIDIATAKNVIPDETKVSEIAGVEQIFDVRTVPIKRINYMALGKLSDRNKDMKLRMPFFSDKLYKAETPLVPAGPEGVTPNTPVAPIVSQNGLERERYIDVTEQLRRMPLGMVIITDQSCMKDILEQLVNIKLRFQITHVEWIRFHGSLSYGTGGAIGAKGGEGGFQGNLAPTSSREDQFSANLMELSIYGIVSMYEKYEAPAKK